MTQNIHINLAVSGVSKINIIENSVIIHAYYNGNDTFYHNLHKIFLSYSDDIVFCQIWFHQVNQNETEAELIVAGAIKTLTITPKTTKSLIILAVDKTLIGAERFFAETVSGDLSIQTVEDSFVTTEVFNQTINNIYNDLSLTAEKIVQNSTNSNSSISSIQLTDNKASFYVQTNTVDYVTNKIYTDWDLNQQPLTLIDQTTTGFTAAQYNALFSDYPRPEYQLLPFHDLNLQDLSFYVIRNFEGWYLNVTEFPLSFYHDRFGIIFDTGMLGSDFVNVKMIDIEIISGSPKANDNVFPSSVVGNVDRSTIKYPYGTFKIWKNNKRTRNNIIFSVPLTNIRVQSTKTTNAIGNLNFWINHEGWYFGDKNDAEKLFAPIKISYDIDTDIANINLEDGMNDTILPVSFARMDPFFGPSEPVSNGQIVFNNANLVDEINFRLRIVASGIRNGQNITIKQGVTPIYTYTTLNTNSAQPNVFDLLIKANSSLIEIVPIVEIKNQKYYDWNFLPTDSSLSVARIIKSPATVLTTAQYDSFNPDSPIVLNVAANGKAPIILNNLSFYTLRNAFDVHASLSASPVYNTMSYKNRVTINIDTTSLSSTEWVPLNLTKIYYSQGRPVANNRMFPASTSSTTNYTSLRPLSGYCQGRINIGNISNAYFTLPIYRINGELQDAIISAKFFIKKNGSNTLLYQGLESESSDIIFSEPNTIPLDLSYQNKIFYPTFSNSYNWVTYSRNFVIVAPYSAAPIGTNIYQFFLRLYCVYGLAGTRPAEGMNYVYQNNAFFGTPTNNADIANSYFTLTLRHQVSSESFDTSYKIKYPTFPMNDLQVVDLIFEVDQNFFNADNAVDAKKKLKYLGQRIVKL